jgi:hypothetical protein
MDESGSLVFNAGEKRVVFLERSSRTVKMYFATQVGREPEIEEPEAKA